MLRITATTACLEEALAVACTVWVVMAEASVGFVVAIPSEVSDPVFVPVSARSVNAVGAPLICSVAQVTLSAPAQNATTAWPLAGEKFEPVTTVVLFAPSVVCKTVPRGVVGSTPRKATILPKLTFPVPVSFVKVKVGAEAPRTIQKPSIEAIEVVVVVEVFPLD
jgi:hypothetical protein